MDYNQFQNPKLMQHWREAVSKDPPESFNGADPWVGQPLPNCRCLSNST